MSPTAPSVSIVDNFEAWEYELMCRAAIAGVSDHIFDADYAAMVKSCCTHRTQFRRLYLFKLGFAPNISSTDASTSGTGEAVNESDDDAVLVDSPSGLVTADPLTPTKNLAGESFGTDRSNFLSKTPFISGAYPKTPALHKTAMNAPPKSALEQESDLIDFQLAKSRFESVEKLAQMDQKAWGLVATGLVGLYATAVRGQSARDAYLALKRTHAVTLSWNAGTSTRQWQG